MTTPDTTSTGTSAMPAETVAAAAEPAVDFTLQILSYYGESGLLGVETAPIMGALIDKFDDEYENTLVLGEGDSFIPGPWLVAGADPSLNAVPGIGTTALARPDIAIMNAFGTDASALGNHEFDLGSPVLLGAVAASGTWAGALFPLITANLDFTNDASLRLIADASLGGTATNDFAGQEASALNGKIAPYAVITQGAEKIGIIGATTFELLSKSSPNGTVPEDDGDDSTSDLEEVAAILQVAIDELKAMGVDKIVMVDQLDTLQRNKDLAPLLTGVDIMVAGGGHERLGDATDTPAAFNGHDADFIATDSFPIVTAGADGAATLIVTTDTEYTYLGRLVVDFDENGEIIAGNLDADVNGAYASTEETLQEAYGTTDSAEDIIADSSIGSEVKAIVDAIDTVIQTKDGEIWGYTDVYLEGDRVFGRVSETNLGNVTADANLAAAADALDSQPFIVSLKNGGGLRSSIGSVDAEGNKVAPLGSSVKPDGAISTLDIENALRFNNRLMVFDTDAQGLLNILNFAANLSSGPTAQSGGYPQIGGLRFSYDATKPAGERVESAGLVDADGNLIARIVEDGAVVDGAPDLISVVILNFTANGGDGYPVKANGENFRYLLDDGTLSGPIDETLDFTAVGTVPANALGEQQALKDYLLENHATPDTAIDTPDTPTAQDERIQQLTQRGDSVLDGVAITDGNRGNSLEGTIGDDTLSGRGGDDAISGGDGNDTVIGGTGGDELAGGFGIDTLSYAGSVAGVRIDLSAETAALGDAAGDAIFSFENVVGSDGNDRLTGNNSANTLSGKLGADVIRGLGGGDTLLGGGGNDTLEGAAGDDRLAGGAGIDTLTGGSGEDSFVLSRAAANADVIADFETGVDQFEISASLFGRGLVAGDLDAGRFAANATGEAGDAGDRFVYNTAAGELFFDVNGSGDGGSTLIATFAGTLPALSAADFLIV